MQGRGPNGKASLSLWGPSLVADPRRFPKGLQVQAPGQALKGVYHVQPLKEEGHREFPKGLHMQAPKGAPRKSPKGLHMVATPGGPRKSPKGFHMVATTRGAPRKPPYRDPRWDPAVGIMGMLLQDLIRVGGPSLAVEAHRDGGG